MFILLEKPVKKAKAYLTLGSQVKGCDACKYGPLWSLHTMGITMARIWLCFLLFHVRWTTCKVPYLVLNSTPNRASNLLTTIPSCYIFKFKHVFFLFFLCRNSQISFIRSSIRDQYSRDSWREEDSRSVARYTDLFQGEEQGARLCVTISCKVFQIKSIFEHERKANWRPIEACTVKVNKPLSLWRTEERESSALERMAWKWEPCVWPSIQWIRSAVESSTARQAGTVSTWAAMATIANVLVSLPPNVRQKVSLLRICNFITWQCRTYTLQNYLVVRMRTAHHAVDFFGQTV